MPTPDGTSLWNLQTQRPEWVPLTDVQGKLSSGAYREYEGSAVNVAPGIGGESAMAPTQAATAVAGGATPTGSEAQIGIQAREAATSAAYDNPGDKALAVLDGAVSGLSGGLLSTEALTSGYDKLVAARNAKENAGYKTVGELGALAATIFSPGAVARTLEFTPLGASNKLFSVVSKATGTALEGRVASAAVRAGLADAAGGAAAASILAASNSVGQALQGKPVSGHAVVDEIGLGALIGGSVGSIASKLIGSANATAKLKAEIEAAAGFAEQAAPIKNTLTDVTNAWNSAHVVAGARVEALEDLARLGHLDAEFGKTGAEWLAPRVSAKAAADKARDNLIKIAGTDNPAEIAARLHDVARAGKARQAEKLYKAFDEYGTAVSEFDSLMRSRPGDIEHLWSAFRRGAPDIDGVMAASEHPLQQLEQMILEGRPQHEIDRFVAEYDAAYNKTAVKEGMTAGRAERAGQATGDIRGRGRRGAEPDKVVPEPAELLGRDTTNHLAPAAAEGDVQIGLRARPRELPPGPEPLLLPPGPTTKAHFRGSSKPTVELPRKGAGAAEAADEASKVVDDVAASTHEAPNFRGDARKTDLLPGRDVPQAANFRGDFRKTGTFVPEPPVTPQATQATTLQKNAASVLQANSLSQARNILDSATAAAAAPKPTQLGRDIQGLMDRLTAVTGNRLGSSEARLLATKLGMNYSALGGPVASKLADLWAMHRISEAIVKSNPGVKLSRKPSLLARALEHGLTSGAGSVAYHAGGPVAAGATRTVVRRMLDVALAGAGSITAVAGRFKQSAVAGMAKALSPGPRRAIQMAHTVSTSYGPDEPPTTDFATKAAQLRNVAANPQAAHQYVAASLEAIKAVDPGAYTRATDAAVGRLLNLARHLPESGSMSILSKRSGPNQAEIRRWQQYEVITNNREAVFEYVRSGSMPQVVVEAMQDQHPDFLQELRTYAIEHPDELAKAPRESLRALSRLLGVPLVPEANPDFVHRQQTTINQAREALAKPANPRTRESTPETAAQALGNAPQLR